MRRWFRVWREGERVVLDIFPLEPGGATLHLTEEEAIWLAGLLTGAARPENDDSPL